MILYVEYQYLEYYGYGEVFMVGVRTNVYEIKCILTSVYSQTSLSWTKWDCLKSSRYLSIQDI